MERLYAVLGLTASATDSEVKSRYRRLVLELHPDKHPGDKLKEEMFTAVTFAYQTIVDGEKRAAFLEGRSGSSHLSPLVEAEQRRAADSVVLTAMHFLLADDDEKHRGIATHYLDAHRDARGVLREVCWQPFSDVVAFSRRLSAQDVIVFVKEEYMRIVFLLFVWCCCGALRFLQL